MMRKLRTNKKMLVSLLAGVVVTLAVLTAATYAWFTASDTAVGDGQFWTATVAVEAENAEFNGYDFYPGADFLHTRDFQSILESFATDPWQEAAMFGIRIRSLYDGWLGDPLRVALTALDVPTTILPNAVYLIQNPFNRTIQNSGTASEFTEVYNVTPGSLLEAKYAFESNSAIPVYFRIDAADLKGVGFDIDDLRYVSTSLVSIIGTQADDDEIVELFGELIREGDYYYCPIPLSPEYGWRAEVCYVTYIYGAANSDAGLQGEMIKFGDGSGISVELIQATNNAVYFADGWLDVADQLIAYVDADLYAQYIANWTAGGYPELQP